MAVLDHYRLLSSVIRIANAVELSHLVRLRTIMQLIAEHFDCVSATLYIADNDKSLLSSSISSIHTEIPRASLIPFGKGLAGNCAASLKTLSRCKPSLHPDEVWAGSERRFIAFPIKDQDHLLGVVTLGVDRKDSPEITETELLQIIILEVAALLRGMRQREETFQRNRELSFLNQISNAMLSTIKLNRLIDQILGSLTSPPTPLFDRAALFLFNERTETLQGIMGLTSQGNPQHPGAETPAFTNRPSSPEAPIFDSLVKLTKIPLSDLRSIIARAVRERTVLSLPHPARKRFQTPSNLQRFGSAPCMVAPLTAQDKIIGALFVDNLPSNRAMQPEELHLLQLFAGQAGMAVENSILYNRLENTNRNLHDAKEQLLQGEKLAAIGRMAAGIAHELKNPLVSVGGFAGRLKKRFALNSEEWQYADLIQREVLHLEKMLSDILFFSKKTTICYVRCTANQIVDDSLTVVAMTLEENSIRIVKSFAPRLASFLGDCQQLRHVFINLFTNAIEVMATGGTLTIETFPSTLDGKRSVSVRVSDTGPGIPSDVRHTIFTPFFTTKESGTGLGLAISHRIISNHGGRIEVCNHSGGGAQFTVTLPLAP